MEGRVLGALFTDDCVLSVPAFVSYLDLQRYIWVCHASHATGRRVLLFSGGDRDACLLVVFYIALRGLIGEDVVVTKVVWGIGS